MLGLIVIDEAHCIDTWGFHFRPSYAELWKLCMFGSPILAMTGTATARTQSVILNSLQLSNKAVVIKQTPNRENLIYHVMEKKSNGFDSIIDLIKQNFSEECGFVYCTERKDTIDVVYHLKGKSGFTTSWAQMKDYTMPTSHTKFLVSRLNVTPEIKRRTCLNLHVERPP